MQDLCPFFTPWIMGKLMLLEFKLIQSIIMYIMFATRFFKSITFVVVYPFCWNGPEIKKTFARQPISINFGVEQKPEKANWCRQSKDQMCKFSKLKYIFLNTICQSEVVELMNEKWANLTSKVWQVSAGQSLSMLICTIVLIFNIYTPTHVLNTDGSTTG